MIKKTDEVGLAKKKGETTILGDHIKNKRETIVIGVVLLDRVKNSQTIWRIHDEPK